jgi:glycosidase
VEREFHIAKDVRDKYEFDKALYGLTGNVIFTNYQSVRLFAYKINSKRNLVENPEAAVRTGNLHTMGLIDEIFHYMFRQYAEENGTDFLEKTLRYVEEKMGKNNLDKVLHRFTEKFPPLDVYNKKADAEQYLLGKTAQSSNRAIALEELILLWFANENPAYEPYRELFDDKELKENTDYLKLIDHVKYFYDNEAPAFGPESASLFDMLLAPIKAHPNSLLEQLQYIRKYWYHFIQDLLFRILTSLDLIKEETKISFTGPGPSKVYEFGGLNEDAERFSPDTDWMPKIVLIAKSVFVWMDQLSNKYDRNIYRLDQIPEEEINLLASQGFNGLWLIGLWERSKASKEIKRKCGNPEAEASAYSLMDYEISERLGGWESLSTLRSRCIQHGIRLASDMVPNHTGIDSRWVVEHPDWYIQLPYSPFPGYTFEGENLSNTEGIGIYIEDHYYDRTDAAVVFKRVDFDSGDPRFIYHGNDGTGMPWNDTAQLNFLNPAAREGVIQTILHVARNFPIIRFDAAMTLAKKHYQRLWFPEPGTGGDIPSRAEHGMTKEEFNSVIPKEFWREVVERVSQEVPDTLLLAEAFWMMEGYFVRSLGMHRVYNSAFMNMLKDEENGKYQQTIRNTLTFDPEILKRFVNFMNNPDEETAVEQFGKGDKYFGICTLMVTMPGLPMFGHGQVEGFREKYGMEYNKAYWNETADKELIKRHEREIFPLMKKRYLFADAKNFKLYEIISDDGISNQNIFAFSNSYGVEHGVVLYNNSYSTGWGRIKTSVEFLEKSNGTKNLRRISLGEALGLTNSYNQYLIFREQRSNLWFIRKSKEIFDDGLFVKLQGYECQVLIDLYEVEDNDELHYSNLYNSLAGDGVENIDEAIWEMYLSPVYDAFHTLFDDKILSFIEEAFNKGKIPQNDQRKDLINRFESFYSTVENYSKQSFNKKQAKDFSLLLDRLSEFLSKKNDSTGEILKKNKSLYITIFAWAVLRYFDTAESIPGAQDQKIKIKDRHFVTRWKLDKQFNKILNRVGVGDLAYSSFLTVLLNFEEAAIEKKGIIPDIVEMESFKDLIGLNEYDNIIWFNKEAFFTACDWIYLSRSLGLLVKNRPDNKLFKSSETNLSQSIKKLKQEAEKSGYNFSLLLKGLKKNDKGKRKIK